jgi:hypothetical protein
LNSFSAISGAHLRASGLRLAVNFLSILAFFFRRSSREKLAWQTVLDENKVKSIIQDAHTWTDMKSFAAFDFTMAAKTTCQRWDLNKLWTRRVGRASGELNQTASCSDASGFRTGELREMQKPEQLTCRKVAFPVGGVSSRDLLSRFRKLRFAVLRSDTSANATRDGTRRKRENAACAGAMNANSRLAATRIRDGLAGQRCRTALAARFPLDFSAAPQSAAMAMQSRRASRREPKIRPEMNLGTRCEAKRNKSRRRKAKKTRKGQRRAQSASSRVGKSAMAARRGENHRRRRSEDAKSWRGRSQNGDEKRF